MSHRALKRSPLPVAVSDQLSDDELIASFQQSANECFFEALIERHRKRVLGRVYANVRSPDDVADVAQLVWINVLNRLDRYEPLGKFSHYLNRIVSNTISDFYRERYARDVPLVSVDASESADECGALTLLAPGSGVEQSWIDKELLGIITQKIVPTMSVEQRFVLLMRHEFDYAPEHPGLSWQRIADLNGLSLEQTRQAYEQGRASMLCAALTGEQKPHEPLPLLIYLLWTQALRPSQEKLLPWKSLAKLLGVTENALKLRYRKVLAELKQQVAEHYQ